jgi:hypothetical protein
MTAIASRQQLAARDNRIADSRVVRRQFVTDRGAGAGGMSYAASS